GTPAPEAADAASGASASAATIGGSSALPAEEVTRLGEQIVTALKTVYDPEIPADIYELGLIYKVDIADDRKVTVDMTLTTPNCPSAAELPAMVENAVASVPGVGEVKVNVIWDPPWDPSRMSDEARVALNMWEEVAGIAAEPHLSVNRGERKNAPGEAEASGEATQRCRRRAHQGAARQVGEADRGRARRRQERRLRRDGLHDGICGARRAGRRDRRGQGRAHPDRSEGGAVSARHRDG